MKRIGQPVRKAYAPHQNAIRRVLNSQAPGQVSGNQPNVPRILKQKVIPSVRCYVCDETIEGRGFPLVVTSTVPGTKINVPHKIGKLMGDGFMVIVSVDDVICKRCSALFNHLDRLETDLERVSNTLSGYLKVKYKLNDAESEGPPAKMIKVEESADDPGEGPSQQEIENQLSHMFGSPVRVAPKEEPKSKVKVYKCVNCEFKTMDLSLFQPHFDKCQKVPRKCNQCEKVFTDINLLKQHALEAHELQQCNICKLSFVDDALYKEHLQVHLNEKNQKTALTVKKKYQCTYCTSTNYSTFDKQVFDEHMKKHIKLRPFKCRVCSQRFESREQATIHAKAHQPDYFKCGLCSVTFQKREALMKHLEKHEANKSATTATTQQQETSISTQKLLHAFTEEALRDTPMEAEENKPNQQDAKQIEFYTCTACSLTFLSEGLHAQHMKMHTNNAVKKTTGQSLIRQEVRNTNVSILNPAQTNNTLSEGDLESIFEKMHSDKIETTQAATISVVTTTESGSISYNINIPPESLKQESSSNSSIKKHENVLIFKCDTCNEAYADNDHLQLHILTSGHGSASAITTPMTIDMPNLDQPEDEANGVANQELQNHSADANTQDATSVENKIDATENNSQQGVSEAADHVPESNTEPVPMELEEDMNNCEQQNEIKLMLDEDNQLVTSDGQILQLDNHILTDSEGNQLLTVQGADNEQLQQLLQSVGVVVQNEDGNEEQLQMLDNSQMVLVQTDDGETKLISSDMLELQHDEDGNVQMTLEQAQAAGYDISALIGKAEDMEEEQDGEKGEEQTMAFSLDELCQLQNEQQAQNDEQNEPGEQDEEKNNPNSQVNKSYICGDCGYSTNLRIEINFHISACHHMCLLCRNIFNSSDLLLEHLTICSKSLDEIPIGYSNHPIMLEESINILENTVNLNNTIFQNDMERNIATKDTVSNFLKFNSENLICLNVRDNENEIKVSEDMNSSANINDSNVYQCELCSMIFLSQLLCNIHIFQKHLLLMCDICGTAFKGQRLLKLHYNSMHKKSDKPKQCFKCSLCLRDFRIKFDLEQHLANLELKFKGTCPFCDYQYVMRTALNEHLTTHADDSKYACKLCGKSFISMKAYELHCRFHKKPSSYTCGDCNAVFNNPRNLGIHKKLRHSGKTLKFKCGVCSKAFISGDSLKCHKMLSVACQNYVYRCEICDTGFWSEYKYSKHTKTMHQTTNSAELQNKTSKDNIIAADSVGVELINQITSVSQVEQQPFIVTVKAGTAGGGLYDIMNINLHDDSVQNLNSFPQTFDSVLEANEDANK